MPKALDNETPIFLGIFLKRKMLETCTDKKKDVVRVSILRWQMRIWCHKSDLFIVSEIPVSHKWFES